MVREGEKSNGIRVFKMKQTYYAIVGAGPAGVAAAEAIREIDSTNPVMLINGEAVPPYCRPLVVEALTGQRAVGEIGLRDTGWHQALGIVLQGSDPVVRVDLAARHLILESGEAVGYEKLLLTTGSVPAAPPIPGLEDVPAHTLYCRRDVDLLRPLCRPGARALILGMGLIGLQAISALHAMGLEVTAVEMKDKILPLILDREAAGLARARIEARGITVLTGTSVVEVGDEGGSGAPYAAVTSAGGKVPFDVLLLATGMRPDMSLVADTGIEADRGIRVSSTMETSIPGVYAAGDVTEYFNRVEGRNEVHAHWLNAYRQGRIAGLSMAGATAEPYEPVFLNSLSVFGLPIVTMGCSRMDEPEGVEVLVDRVAQRPWYRRFLLKDGRLVAATFMNDVEGAGALQYLVRENVELSASVARSLFANGLEGVKFLGKLHHDAVRGELEWPASMDLIDKFKKNMKHTRWA